MLSCPGIKRSVLTLVMALSIQITNVFAAQSVPSRESTEARMLEDILSELKQLRTSTERINTLSLDMQVTFQRIQIEQSRMMRISSELDSIQRDRGIAEAEQVNESKHLSYINNQLDESRDGVAQKELRDEQLKQKEVTSRCAVRVQELQASEASKAALLEIERSKMEELESYLDILQRSLKPGKQ